MARGITAEMFARARTADACARRTGCGIAEATEVVASQAQEDQGSDLSRRRVLGGGGAALLAAAIPLAKARPASASAESGAGSIAGSRDQRIVIIGSGLAGLGRAYKLWRKHGLRSEIYEYNAERAGGRVQTLRGFFDGGQYTEQHGEFISSEHTQMRALAAGFGLKLDNVISYPPETRPLDSRMRFGGRFWSQEELDRAWHEWARALFLEAANVKAPWPTQHDHYTRWGRRWDQLSVAEWVERNIPGGLRSDFGRLCVAVALDEYGGPVEEQSALNLIYLLGSYASAPSGLQPKSAPELSGSDEKWHIRHGNDQIIRGLHDRLPRGSVHLGERLVALRGLSNGTYACTFASGPRTREVRADHVVLALPFTRLREVELTGIGLPGLQRRAIRQEPLSTNAKIQLQFSRRVWNADHWTGNLYTDEIAQGGWETTIDQPGPDGILVALPGGEVGANLGRRYGLSASHGPAPAAMARDFLQCFETSFPGVSAAYSGKAYYAWSAGDPHIGGAYSYLKVGQYTGFNGIQGRRHGNLHVAGEHTSADFQGYMEGALRTGYRCAGEIAGA